MFSAFKMRFDKTFGFHLENGIFFQEDITLMSEFYTKMYGIRLSCFF